MKQAGRIAPERRMPALARSSDCAEFSPRATAHAPLAGLAGSDLAQRFRWWRGGTGRRYMFSVFRILPERVVPLGLGCDGVGAEARLDHCPRYDAAIILAVACDAEGQRRILHMDETGTLPDLFFTSESLKQALRQGANEIHIHLLAENAVHRRAILHDLED